MNFCVAIFILKMKEKTLQHNMLYYFKKAKNTMERHKKFCSVFGDGPVTDWMCQKWFLKFHADDFSLDNATESRWSVEIDSDQTQTLIKNNQCNTMWEIAHILKIPKSSTENHLRQLGYVSHFDVWVPHKLSEENFLDCVSTCDFLLKHNENIPFFKTNCDRWWKMDTVQ